MSEKLPVKKESAIKVIASELELKGKIETFNQLLSKEPRPSWVRTHPFQKKLKYIPIEIIEEMLRKIFQQFDIEVKQVQPLFNSVQVTVRVNYLHPITNTWRYVDGVGAVNVQTDKGASAADLGAIKANAIQLAVPAAKSYAIKDAVENLGTIFGANLNRRDVPEINSPWVDHSTAMDKTKN